MSLHSEGLGGCFFLSSAEIPCSPLHVHRQAWDHAATGWCSTASARLCSCLLPLTHGECWQQRGCSFCSAIEHATHQDDRTQLLVATHSRTKSAAEGLLIFKGAWLVMLLPPPKEESCRSWKTPSISEGLRMALSAKGFRGLQLLRLDLQMQRAGRLNAMLQRVQRCQRSADAHL